MTKTSQWSVHRSQICSKDGIANFNAATCSPLPHPVALELARLRDELAGDPVGFIFGHGLRRIERARRELGEYLCGPHGSLLLCPNATYGVHTMLRSLDWGRGDEILMTDEEYAHYGVAWHQLAESLGFHVKKVALGSAAELTPEIIIDLFRDALSEQTRLVFFSHVTSATGLVLPATSLCQLTRDHKILSFVDGAHAVGNMPVDISAINPDFYVANVHKWMMGATGSAFLYVSRECRPLLKPLIITEHQEYRPEDEDAPIFAGGPSRWAHSLEYQGTQDRSAQMVIPSVLAFRRSIGESALRERTKDMASYARRQMSKTNLEPLSRDHPDLQSNLLAYRLPFQVDPIKSWLWFRDERGLEGSFPHLDDGEYVFRVSPTWFNTTQEIDQLAEAVRQAPWESFVSESR